MICIGAQSASKTCGEFVRFGKVYLVGAGPGHPELLTLKAAELIRNSDVIIYDRLIQEEVLALAKPSAERIYMGKSVGSHGSRQEEIHELLVRKAREGKTVVRLKGGDPFLFGRGGEEAETLADHGIPFEVIPGVSSALAAPLAAGIAVTHREAGSAVAIVTGHEADRETSRLDWDALAGIDTLVFLMGVAGVGRIARELMAHGRDPETPAAMVQMAFWHGEKVVEGTLATIAGEVERAGVVAPATLVVGETVRLREKLKHAQRDLKRRPDDGIAFQPAPAPDQLFRMATAGIGSQVLRFGLAASLFDHLVEWQTPSALAVKLGVNTRGLAEVLECLVSLGLLETGPEGYRNLELASRYLVDGSAQSLKPALLYQAAHQTPLTAVGRYVLNGREDGVQAEDAGLLPASCECLARFAAPFVAEKLDLAGCRSLLVFGWGAESYREIWPDLRIEACNPFGEDAAGGAPSGPAPGYDAVLVSGLLACCGPGQFSSLLAGAARYLRPGGMLAVHDAFLPSDAAPAPESVLLAFGRHVARRGAGNWTGSRLEAALGSCGLEHLWSVPLPGGTSLVAARKGPVGTRENPALESGQGPDFMESENVIEVPEEDR